MKVLYFVSNRWLALAAALLISAGLATANAEEPCPPNGDFGECKVLVEINSTDGDIGFHFLMDGDDLIRAKMYSPTWRRIFSYITRGPLREQFLTETFAESAEPLCWPDPEAVAEAEAEGDELEIVTLEDFIDLWPEGTYRFFGIGEDWEVSYGRTTLMFDLPAAPKQLAYEEDVEDDDIEGEISWKPGNDLGNCADYARLKSLVMAGDLPMHPKHVPVAAWEVVLEPDVDDGDPLGAMKYVVRIPGDAEELEVGVSDDYLETLPKDTKVKIEVGAIGEGENATFTEIFDVCVNLSDPEDDEACLEDEEEE